MLDTYIKKIASITKRGDAREESYYPDLKNLLETFSIEKRKKKAQVTVLPKKTEAGNPDFRVWDGKHSQVGYVEAKIPTAKLDDVQETEQLERYRATFPNLILTNFYEFRLYRNGQMIDKVQLARPFIAAKLGSVPPVEHEREFLQLLDQFFSFSLPTKFTAESLAKQLAIRTRFLRDQVIKEELREASSGSGKKILNFYDAFRKHLIANLEPDQFADLYAQTITYGLFAARTRAEREFSRAEAYTLIPKTIGILRDIFHFVSYDPPEQMQVTVDDIAEVLAAADVKEILHQYFDEGKGSDPIFHFYETFLAEYNPEERERRGVYYTPEPVVSYIVRSLDIILKEKFGRQDGLATQNVTVLDPAGGTLTFLADAAKLAVEEHTAKYGKGSKKKFIEDHILEHFYAFELMMAPYAAGHLKMGYLLEELGHKLSGDERFQFYLTNTLEMENLARTAIPGMESLTEESELAGKVKKHQPILVILGNPPYSGHSSNKGDWITKQIESYKMVDGKPLGEKNPKWLQDDYVKFIRFAQWKIDQMGEGVLGFITNHSYLDNPTFRGMRQSLLNSFNEIYILDLHGNSLKKEKAPDGSKDENVFDIRQGVSIAIFIKEKEKKKECKIFHADLFGKREKKYDWLSKNEIKKTKWKQIHPRSDLYLFIPRDEELLSGYERYWKITEMFALNSVGIVTSRDDFAVDEKRETLVRRMQMFRDRSEPDELIARAFGLKDTGAWKLKTAREELMSDSEYLDSLRPILYRPFDTRWIFYHDAVIERTRREVMQHMFGENISLIVPRRVETAIPWAHAFISNCITDHVAVSLKTIDYCFPLSIYKRKDDEKKKKTPKIVQMMMVFEPEEEYGEEPELNYSPVFRAWIKDLYKKPISGQQVFNYIYAVLYSNAYRKKYAEFLKSDFPRVPFTSDYRLFTKLATKGEELVELHLLKSKKLEKSAVKCEGTGNLRVEKVAYEESKKRVYINPETYFAGVPSEVWEYHVGGYQVAEKWLKDRKERTLSSDEVTHYCKVVAALAETIKIQKGLDESFEEVEKSILGITGKKN
jgi:predicted helicase